MTVLDKPNRDPYSWGKGHARMTNAERAKQFLPFAAVRGLPEALAKREIIPVPRKTPSEDWAEEIDRSLRSLHPGQKVRVVYYTGQSYDEKTGLLAKLDPRRRMLTVVDTPIAFDDLWSIEAADEIPIYKRQEEQP